MRAFRAAREWLGVAVGLISLVAGREDASQDQSLHLSEPRVLRHTLPNNNSGKPPHDDRTKGTPAHHKHKKTAHHKHKETSQQSGVHAAHVGHNSKEVAAHHHQHDHPSTAASDVAVHKEAAATAAADETAPQDLSQHEPVHKTSSSLRAPNTEKLDAIKPSPHGQNYVTMEKAPRTHDDETASADGRELEEVQLPRIDMNMLCPSPYFDTETFYFRTQLAGYFTDLLPSAEHIGIDEGHQVISNCSNAAMRLDGDDNYTHYIQVQIINGEGEAFLGSPSEGTLFSAEEILSLVTEESLQAYFQPVCSKWNESYFFEAIIREHGSNASDPKFADCSTDDLKNTTLLRPADDDEESDENDDYFSWDYLEPPTLWEQYKYLWLLAISIAASWFSGRMQKWYQSTYQEQPNPSIGELPKKRDSRPTRKDLLLRSCLMYVSLALGLLFLDWKLYALFIAYMVSLIAALLCVWHDHEEDPRTSIELRFLVVWLLALVWLMWPIWLIIESILVNGILVPLILVAVVSVVLCLRHYFLGSPADTFPFFVLFFWSFLLVFCWAFVMYVCLGSRRGPGGGVVFVGGGSRSGGGGGSCFPAGQSILMEDFESEIPIETLRAGSMIAHGGRVTAVMKLAFTFADPMYVYNDSVIVTGSHLVLEDDEWKPVETSEIASLMPLEEASPAFVYNLITSNHKVHIHGTLFADWEEQPSWEQTWLLETKILKRLNDGRTNNDMSDEAPLAKDPHKPITEGAFSATTPILLSNGTLVPIADAQPGDELHHGNDYRNRIFAVMQVWIPEDTVIYRYKDDIIATEFTVVLDHDGLWRHVKDSSRAQAIGTAASLPNAIWYQLWTTSHTVPTTESKIDFADYHVIDEADPLFLEEL